MKAFEGVTPKRHRVWSNDQVLLQHIFNAGGYLPKNTLQSGSAETALVKKYVDKNGKVRRVGIPEKLKKSQCLVLMKIWDVALIMVGYIYIYR